jgi:hypothetical protein
MSIKIERVVEASPELHDLIGELNDVLGAAYEAHQRHGLSIDQLFEPRVRFFLARLDGVAVFDDYAEVKRMYTRLRGTRSGSCEGSSIHNPGRGPQRRQVGLASRNGHLPAGGNRSLRTYGVSLTWSFRAVYGNASPQHRDESLLREDSSLFFEKILP